MAICNTMSDFYNPRQCSKAIIHHFWHMYIFFCSTKGKIENGVPGSKVLRTGKKVTALPTLWPRMTASRRFWLFRFFLAEKKKKE